MALTKEQAINLVNQNEDKDRRIGYPERDMPELLEIFYKCKSERADYKETGYRRTLQEIDARIESCDFPDMIAKQVYLALLEREEIEYLMNL